MRDEDLAPFAVADGLLARINAAPDHLSEAEKDWLLLMGAKTLARVADMDPAQAYRLIHPFTPKNQATIQAGSGFAAIFAYGRLLYTTTRHDLRGTVHPERN